MDASAEPERSTQVLEAARVFAAATADAAQPDLYGPLTFLLAQVRRALGMDVVFVSQFVDRQRVFEIVSAEGQLAGQIARGGSDPLLDSYCQRIVDGRLPAIIRDTAASPEAASLAITQTFDIRAYLSAPVILPNGEVFGTVCCISHKTRNDLREADARALKAVAEAVAASIGAKGTVRYASWTKS